MFGLAKAADPKEEAEAKRIEAMKTSVSTSLEHLKGHAEAGNTDRCEAAAKRIAESLKNPKLPNDFTKQAREVLDALLLHCFMKATAIACKAAIEAGKSDDTELRSKKIKEAREKLSGAVKHKAPQDFKMQCERLLEVALMSGGVKAKGPTKAKPKDTAPKPTNQAKISDEEFARKAKEEADAAKAAAEKEAAERAAEKAAAEKAAAEAMKAAEAKAKANAKTSKTDEERAKARNLARG